MTNLLRFWDCEYHGINIYLSCCLVTQSCLTFCDPMDCRPPGSCVHGISQARILEWVATSFSRGSSWPRDGTRSACVSCIGSRILAHCTTREAPFPYPEATTVSSSFCVLLEYSVFVRTHKHADTDTFLFFISYKW